MVVDVSSNYLNGVVSNTHLANLSNLQHLDLSFNSLSLRFTSDCVPLFQLDTIKLSSCMLGPRFPSWFHTQRSFSTLDISNSGISDFIPSWFWNLPSKLQYLNLSMNHINGNVPNNPLKFNYVPTIDLSSNQFYGPMPLFFTNTTVLNLSQNRFNGSISFLCKTMERVLNYLDLSNNQLSGELQDCWMNWKEMIILNLANNNFSGKIPSSMGSLEHLQTLHLNNNGFLGEVPMSLKYCSQLKLLDLGENRLSGNIPAWIGENLTGLIVLRLRRNEFIGDIPSSLCRLSSIQILDLSLNSIVGNIPTCLSNLTAMIQNGSFGETISYDSVSSYPYWQAGGVSIGYSSNYVDHASVIWKGLESEYGKTLGLLRLIDLSSNKLDGGIPGEVTSRLGLVTMNLSENHLTGNIPNKIGQIKSLESLDLSRNRLSGEIPVSLADISYLSYFDLSENNLSGKIPSGRQLQTFTASAYMGNPNLCGPPLITKCPGDDTVKEPSSADGGKDNPQEDEEWYETSGFFISIGLGFIFGFLGIFGSLVLNRNWRHSYFQFLSGIGDRLYLMIALNKARLQR